MARATLSYVSLSSIEPNPFRDLKNYPFEERKIEALMRSFEDVGIWEGMIGREHGKRYQLAFGHHRWEAARRCKIGTVPIILRDLTDEEMVGFMGRENLEDFNSDFLAQLNAWEAAIKVKTWSGDTLQHGQAIGIARLLGWTSARSGRDGDMMNDTAKACHSGTMLIQAGHLARGDLAGMTIDAARLVVERVHSRIEMLDKMGKMGGRPAAEITREKKHVASAGRQVAKDVREGNISHKNIRSEIDHRAVTSATAKGRVSPLFAAFATDLANGIHKMLVSDSPAARLAQMQEALPLITMEEDHAALRRIDFALAEHGETTANWRDRLTPKGRRVVPFKLLKKENIS